MGSLYSFDGGEMDPLMVGEALSLLVCSILIGERCPNSLSRLYLAQPCTRLLFMKLLDLEASIPFLKTCQKRVGVSDEWLTCIVRL